MKSQTKSMLLVSLCLGFSFVTLTVLITARPEEPTANYWMTLGVNLIAIMVFLLCLPFARRFGARKILPENLDKPVMTLIIGAVWLILAVAVVGALIRLHLGVVLILGVVLVGITNVLKDLIRSGEKKKKRPKTSL